jgi:hypothetical protein
VAKTTLGKPISEAGYAPPKGHGVLSFGHRARNSDSYSQAPREIIAVSALRRSSLMCRS